MTLFRFGFQRHSILCIEPMQVTCGLPQPDGADTNPELATAEEEKGVDFASLLSFVYFDDIDGVFQDIVSLPMNLVGSKGQRIFW